MRKGYSRLLPQAHLWMDIVLLNGSFIFAYFTRFGDSVSLVGNQYLNLLLAGNLLWILITHLLKTYHFTRLSYNFNNQITEFGKTALVHAGVLVVLIYFTQQGEEFSRKQFLFTYGFFMVAATFARATSLIILQLYRRAGYNYRNYAVIGKGDLASMITGFYDERPELGYRYRGQLQNATSADSLGDVENFIEKENLDYIYCCLSEMNDESVRGIIRIAERKRTQVRLVPDFRGFLSNMASIEYHDMYPVIEVNTKPFSSAQEETVKRVFDVVFSSVVMILGAPIFLMVMAMVKVSSPGPVFFLQERSGRWGNLFKIMKFRTMYADSHKFNMQHSQGDYDPRITPIGRILRRTRLDELPQFLNVIKGDMSIVGPRPLYKYDVDMLMQEAPDQFQKLLTVRPGITSIGQIKVGYASNAQENVQRLRYDMQYLRKYSLKTDVLLIFQTVQVMVLGRGR